MMQKHNYKSNGAFLHQEVRVEYIHNCDLTSNIDKYFISPKPFIIPI